MGDAARRQHQRSERDHELWSRFTLIWQGNRLQSGAVSLGVMATYTIRTFGDPVLKQRAREVEELDGALARLVDTMYETMYEASGVGLAAPQVGVQRRIFTYDVGEGPEVLVNPEIVASSGDWSFEEGCLSIPGLAFEIVRPKIVTVRGLDLDGNE